MFDHVTVRVSDRGESERFYDAVLGRLGLPRNETDGQFAEWQAFSLCEASRSHPVTRRLHVAFSAPSHQHVEAFWQAGTAAGYMDDGRPGPRPRYGDDYFGSFLRDPDGNSVEAVHHGKVAGAGAIDHVWLRATDLEASCRFYEAVAGHAGYGRTEARDQRVTFAGENGSFTVVAGRPTECLHLAFAAADGDRIAAFHRDLVGAGYRDDGGPGERPQYHPGYTAAYVLDPDGNSVELVCHNR